MTYTQQQLHTLSSALDNIVNALDTISSTVKVDRNTLNIVYDTLVDTIVATHPSLFEAMDEHDEENT